MTQAAQGPPARRQRRGRLATRALALLLVSGGGLGATARAGAGPTAGCQAASTTLAMQECLALQLRQVDQELERYIDRAQRRLSAERDLPAGAVSRAAAHLAASQRSWQRSRDRYCQALWSFWSAGTIRGPMLLSCRIALARERQRRIWLDFLSFADGSPPLLPEPLLPEPPLPASGSRP